MPYGAGARLFYSRNALFQAFLLTGEAAPAVNTPLFNTSFSIGGMSDSFDRSRRTMSLNVSAGA